MGLSPAAGCTRPTLRTSSPRPRCGQRSETCGSSAAQWPPSYTLLWSSVQPGVSLYASVPPVPSQPLSAPPTPPNSPPVLTSYVQSGGCGRAEPEQLPAPDPAAGPEGSQKCHGLGMGGAAGRGDPPQELQSVHMGSATHVDSPPCTPSPLSTEKGEAPNPLPTGRNWEGRRGLTGARRSVLSFSLHGGQQEKIHLGGEETFREPREQPAIQHGERACVGRGAQRGEGSVGRGDGTECRGKCERMRL